MEYPGIGKRIEHTRMRRGMSLSDLARAAAVSKSLLSQLENGKRDGERTALGIFRSIARALGVSLDYLAGMYEYDKDDEPKGYEPAAVTLVGA